MRIQEKNLETSFRRLPKTEFQEKNLKEKYLSKS